MSTTLRIGVVIISISGFLSGCQFVSRSATFFGLSSGFTLDRYEHKDVAIFPAVNNPAFNISDRDRATIRDVFVTNLKLVSKFHVVVGDLPSDRPITFPYDPVSQSQAGHQLGYPATIGISVPSLERTGTGSISQITIMFTFVDSESPQQQVTATQVYKLASAGDGLDLKGPGFDMAMFEDLLRLRYELTAKKTIKENAIVDASGPAVVAIVNPNVVLAGGNQAGAIDSTGSQVSETHYATIPIRVIANDFVGLKSVSLINRTTNTKVSLLDSDSALNSSSRPPPKYLDNAVEMTLIPGLNSFVASGINVKGASTTRSFQVDRAIDDRSSLALLLVAATDDAVSLKAVQNLYQSMSRLSGGYAPPVLLAGKDANYDGVLSSARSIDRAAKSVGGASIVYFKGHIVRTDDGALLMPYDARFAPQVSGIPLDELLVSFAPRLVFFDLCAEDSGGSQPLLEVRPDTAANNKKPDFSADRAPALYSVHSCIERSSAPVADRLIAFSEVAHGGGDECINFGELFDFVASTPGVFALDQGGRLVRNTCIVK